MPRPLCSTIVVFRSGAGDGSCAGFFRFRRNAETVYVGTDSAVDDSRGRSMRLLVQGCRSRRCSRRACSSSAVSLILTAASCWRSPIMPGRRRRSEYFVPGTLSSSASPRRSPPILPGLSRSGSTIATGLLLGDRKDQVAQLLVPDGADPDSGRGDARRC